MSKKNKNALCTAKFTEDALTPCIMRSALNRCGYTGINLESAKTASYAFLCSRTISDKMLAPFEDALKTSGIKEDICAFEALMNVAIAADTLWKNTVNGTPAADEPLKQGPLSIEVMRQMADRNCGVIKGAIFIGLDVLMDNDFDEILYVMSEKLTGSRSLMQIDYTFIPASSSEDSLCFEVTGDATSILEEYDDE